MTDTTRKSHQQDTIVDSAEAAERFARMIELAAWERAQPEPPEVAERLARMNELAREGQAAPLSPDQAERLERMNELSDISSARTPQARNAATGEADEFPSSIDTVQASRAAYQFQINSIQAFRPKPKPRRRDYGYER